MGMYGCVTGLELISIEETGIQKYKNGYMILDIKSEEDKDVIRHLSPDAVAREAMIYKPKHNIGIAYTLDAESFNYEYVRDCARYVKQMHMDNCIVASSCIDEHIMDQLLADTDAICIALSSDKVAEAKDMAKKYSGKIHMEFHLLAHEGDETATELKGFKKYIEKKYPDINVYWDPVTEG